MVNQKILKNPVQGMIKEVELASCIIKSSEVQSFPVVSPFLYIFIVFHRIKIFLVTHAPTIRPNFAFPQHLGLGTKTGIVAFLLLGVCLLLG